MEQGPRAEKHHGIVIETPVTLKWVKRNKDFLNVIAGKMVNLPAPLVSSPDLRSGDPTEVRRYYSVLCLITF